MSVSGTYCRQRHADEMQQHSERRPQTGQLDSGCPRWKIIVYGVGGKRSRPTVWMEASIRLRSPIGPGVSIPWELSATKVVHVPHRFVDGESDRRTEREKVTADRLHAAVPISTRKASRRRRGASCRAKAACKWWQEAGQPLIAISGCCLVLVLHATLGLELHRLFCDNLIPDTRYYTWC